MFLMKWWVFDVHLAVCVCYFKKENVKFKLVERHDMLNCGREDR